MSMMLFRHRWWHCLVVWLIPLPAAALGCALAAALWLSPPDSLGACTGFALLVLFCLIVAIRYLQACRLPLTRLRADDNGITREGGGLPTVVLDWASLRLSSHHDSIGAWTLHHPTQPAVRFFNWFGEADALLEHIRTRQARTGA